MNEQEVRLAHRSHQEGMVEGKDEVIDEIYGEDFENHSRGLPDYLLHGTNAIHQHYAFLRSAFSDIGLEADQQIVEDDLIGFHWTWTARHTGDFLGMPPTGERVQIEGFEVLQVRDGKIRAAWIVQDNVSLMGQLQAALQRGASGGSS